MKKTKKIVHSFKNLMANTNESYFIFLNEFKAIFKDRGVLIILLVAPILYPLLYCSIYRNESLTNVPIGAVDASHSKLSNELLRRIDATPDVNITYSFDNLEAAKKAFDERKIRGVIYIPADFSKRINTLQTATVAVYCNMSSFMYYRTILMASNYSVLDMNKKIQVERLNTQGVTGENAIIQADPIPYDSRIFFNGGMGFASFLMPTILILVLHQTLFLGISMVTGFAREENRLHQLVSPLYNRGGVFRVLFGKAMCYFMIYIVWVVFALLIVPHLFNLPHIGSWMVILKFMIPFLLATIFFSMTISVFFPNRETGIIIFLFFSLVLLFLSGVSWPMSNMNGFWRAFGWIFPSTHGIQGYVKINSLAADLRHVKYEYLSLWGQTALYFITATLAYRWQMRREKGRDNS